MKDVFQSFHTGFDRKPVCLPVYVHLDAPIVVDAFK
jgi:hypothetical protein